MRRAHANYRWINRRLPDFEAAKRTTTRLTRQVAELQALIARMEHATDDALTPREIAVLALIARGNSNRSVGEHLAITEQTVKGHVKSILSKLSANDRAHAVALGIKRGIIEL